MALPPVQVGQYVTKGCAGSQSLIPIPQLPDAGWSDQRPFSH